MTGTDKTCHNMTLFVIKWGRCVKMTKANAYTIPATWLHGYGLWAKPSSDQNIPSVLSAILFLYSWIVIMSPLLALMMILRYLRGH